MPKQIRGVMISLTLLTLLAIISTTMAGRVGHNLTHVGDSGFGFTTVEDPLNPGETMPAASDIVYRQICWCEADPTWPNQTSDAGAYIHIEYFNHYHQIYYSLEHFCTLDPGVRKEDDTSCSPEIGFVPPYSYPFFHDYKACVTSNETGIEWCYRASRDPEICDDSIFGVTRRDVCDMYEEGNFDYVEGGRFGLLYDTQDEVTEACDSLCRTKLDPGLTAYKLAPGRRLTENRIDEIDVGWLDRGDVGFPPVPLGDDWSGKSDPEDDWSGKSDQWWKD